MRLSTAFGGGDGGLRAATYELKCQRQLAALRAATGAWKLADHPELKAGSVAYQRKLRAEGEGRIERQRK